MGGRRGVPVAPEDDGPDLLQTGFDRRLAFGEHGELLLDQLEDAAPGRRGGQIHPGHLPVGRQEVVRAKEQTLVDVRIGVQDVLVRPLGVGGDGGQDPGEFVDDSLGLRRCWRARLQ